MIATRSTANTFSFRVNQLVITVKIDFQQLEIEYLDDRLLVTPESVTLNGKPLSVSPADLEYWEGQGGIMITITPDFSIGVLLSNEKKKAHLIFYSEDDAVRHRLEGLLISRFVGEWDFVCTDPYGVYEMATKIRQR